jgi:hypothetical protein
MFTIIIKSRLGIKTYEGDNEDSLVTRAEALNMALRGGVYWYTVLDTATGEQTHTALINEGA